MNNKIFFNSFFSIILLFGTITYTQSVVFGADNEQTPTPTQGQLDKCEKALEGLNKYFKAYWAAKTDEDAQKAYNALESAFGKMEKVCDEAGVH